MAGGASFEVQERTAVVAYPSASSSYTRTAVTRAIATCLPDFCIVDSPSAISSAEGSGHRVPALQVSDYDEIEWQGVKELETHVLVNAYPIRKALIRKNAMHQTIVQHLAKHGPSLSSLRKCVPQTFAFELAFADELEELFADELYDLGEELSQTEQDEDVRRLWILKPAMADRGQGIRLLRTRQDLERIFEGFEMSDDEEEDEEKPDTAVSTSQLRHWIIQRYIDRPLLLDPDASGKAGRKHHLRVYVLAVGALEVYVYTEILALFAATPYSLPPPASINDDLSAHLTNTCLQSSNATVSDPDANVHLFSSLLNIPILSDDPSSSRRFTQEDQDRILDSICATTADLFRAAAVDQAGAHFQLLPNAFEIFGLDYLVDEEMRPWLLEVNACPDFAQTGPRLSPVIDRLFQGALTLAAVPFFAPHPSSSPPSLWPVGPATRHGFRKCLSVKVRA